MGDVMNFNFDIFYNLAQIVFKPLSNFLNIVKVNGTSLLAILVTLFLVLLILRFVLRAPSTGLSGISRAAQSSKHTKKGGD